MIGWLKHQSAFFCVENIKEIRSITEKQNMNKQIIITTTTTLTTTTTTLTTTTTTTKYHFYDLWMNGEYSNY